MLYICLTYALHMLSICNYIEIEIEIEIELEIELKIELNIDIKPTQSISSACRFIPFMDLIDF